MNDKCILSDIIIGTRFKTLIKIDSIWINTLSKKFGLKINLIQLKIIKPISTIICLIDNEYPINNQYQHQHQQQHQNQHQQQHQHQQLMKITANNETIQKETIQKETIPNIIIQQQAIIIDKIIFRPPDPMQLLQLKKSLKKVIE